MIPLGGLYTPPRTYGRILFDGRIARLKYRANRAPLNELEALHPTRLGTWMLRRDLVKRVAQGLSREDAGEMALAWGAIIPGQTFHAWPVLWLQVAMLSLGVWLWTWGPALLESPMHKKVSVFAHILAEGLRPLPIWKVCRRGLGVEHGWARKTPPADAEADGDPAWKWRLGFGAIMAVVFLVTLYSGDASAHPSHPILQAAFTNFYMDAGGNDMNAGSVINAAASVTSTNGSWDITADTFIATAGTPFSGVAVGEWVSIYVDGTTSGAVYVAQVTALHVGGLGVVLSTTAKYGTKPSASATGRSAKVGGSWLTPLPIASGGLGAAAPPAATKVNITGNQASLGALTISQAATTTLPIWYSGYNTTPGDLDADTTNALAPPVWTFSSTASITTSGAYQLWTGLSMTGVRSGQIWNANGASQRHSRCRVSNTSSNAAAVAFNPNSSLALFSYSYYTTPSTATTSGTVSLSNVTQLLGCVVDTGGTGGVTATTTNLAATQCIFQNNGHGVLASTGQIQLRFCTISNATTDGVKWSGTPQTGSSIFSCLFRICGNAGINNASGTNTGNVSRSCNGMYSVSGGRELGMGDSPEFFPIVLSTDPCVSNSNLSLVAVTLAKTSGFPGIFEAQTFSSFADEGGAQHADPPSAGVAIFGG